MRQDLLDNFNELSVDKFNLIGITTSEVFIIPGPGEVAIVEKRVSDDASVGGKNEWYVGDKQVDKSKSWIGIFGNLGELLKDEVLAAHVVAVREVDLFELRA